MASRALYLFLFYWVAPASLTQRTVPANWDKVRMIPDVCALQSGTTFFAFLMRDICHCDTIARLKEKHYAP